jgi:hypothetical protein
MSNNTEASETCQAAAADQRKPGLDENQTMPYALIALGSVLAGIGVLAILLRHIARLADLGLVGYIYYPALVLFGLGASTILCKILKSSASFRGKYFGGVLQLGGAIVVAALVVIGGAELFPAATSFSLTVYVHGARGPDDLVLRNQGYVVLDLGPDRRREPIGDKGQANFSGIPATFLSQPIRAWVEDEDYTVLRSNERRRIYNGTLDLVVQRRNAQISGYVRTSEGNPIVNARANIYDISTTTDQSGFFQLLIPGPRTEATMNLFISAVGFHNDRYEVVPNGNPTIITLDYQTRPN